MQTARRPKGRPMTGTPLKMLRTDALRSLGAALTRHACRVQLTGHEQVTERHSATDMPVARWRTVHAALLDRRSLPDSGHWNTLTDMLERVTAAGHLPYRVDIPPEAITWHGRASRAVQLVVNLGLDSDAVQVHARTLAFARLHVPPADLPLQAHETYQQLRADGTCPTIAADVARHIAIRNV